ncbi:hypothetical protein KFV02_04785 [Desulfohalobiaceae bacterium Ax17]|uniref:hypothetical protein n=1 Tax=Desulfovulcanus ferrireducens TaxID=2831190 RepID=UPI00207BBD07|nr:hypothetical protein [Desulfovulcanus ferrireducens]MBT8763244.1 hypothetical protein [Desulfovulcanus ferrireducens]
MKTAVQKGLSKHGAVLINVTSAGYLTVFDCKKICFLGEEDFCKGRGVRRGCIRYLHLLFMKAYILTAVGPRQVLPATCRSRCCPSLPGREGYLNFGSYCIGYGYQHTWKVIVTKLNHSL